MTQPMPWSRTVGRLLLIGGLLALVAALAMPVRAAAARCPGEPGGNEFKIEVGTDPNEGTLTIGGVDVDYTIDGPTVTFSTEVTFCVKAATQASGELTGTTFTVYWLNDGGKTPDISYVVIYSVTTETPTPTPSETPLETPPGGTGNVETPAPEIPNTATQAAVDLRPALIVGSLLLVGLGALVLLNLAARRR